MTTSGPHLPDRQAALSVASEYGADWPRTISSYRLS
jgi:hypothetical protein